MEKSWRSDRPFVIWVTVVICWAGTACAISHICPKHYIADRTFRKMGKTPQEDAKIQAWHEKIEWCDSRLGFLAGGALVLALVGVCAFFRRGCAVFILAVTLVFVCCLAWMATNSFWVMWPEPYGRGCSFINWVLGKA